MPEPVDKVKEMVESIEHTRYRNTVIRTIAVLIKAETGKDIPADVMMVGDQYVNLVKFKKRTPEALTYRHRSMGLYAFEPSVSIAKLIEDFYHDKSEISLIPEGDTRKQEAKELGNIIEEQKHFFVVQRGNQQISVYEIRDVNYSIDEHVKLRDGLQIGLTTFPPMQH